MATRQDAPVRKLLTPEQVKSVIFNPNDAVKLALTSIEERALTRRGGFDAGVKIFIPEVDEVLCPLRPGDLAIVMGRTSNYKSGLMMRWARCAALEINEVEKLPEDTYVLYVTWEMAVEEVLATDLGVQARVRTSDLYQGRIDDNTLAALRNIGMQRASLPLWIVGHSVSSRLSRPALSLTGVGQVIQHIRHEFGMRPRAVFLDYLQQIDFEAGEDRREQVFNGIKRCKDMALAFGCPVIAATQVNREGYKNDWGVPTVESAMDSSNTEHTADKIFGVWLPKTSRELGDKINHRLNREKVELEVTDNLLVFKLLKQRLGPAGQWWPFLIDYETNDLTLLQAQPLNG